MSGLAGAMLQRHVLILPKLRARARNCPRSLERCTAVGLWTPATHSNTSTPFSTCLSNKYCCSEKLSSELINAEM